MIEFVLGMVTGGVIATILVSAVVWGHMSEGVRA